MLSGSTSAKAAPKMLMKLTPGAGIRPDRSISVWKWAANGGCPLSNYTNISQAAFLPISFPNKFTNTNFLVYKSFDNKNNSIHKVVSKMLEKLSPVINFTNILRAAFVPICFFNKMIKPDCK